MEKTLRETPVIRCEHGANCKWKCFALDYYGNGIGTLKNYEGAWKEWHEKQCGGKLIQSFIVDEDYLSLLSHRIKADATDFDALCCDGCYKITEKMTTAEADVYCLNCTLKAVAASQLQAVLGELE